MRYFPVFLDLDGRTVVVVGGGEEALRKLRLLTRTGAHIRVVADRLDPEIATMARVSRLDGPFDGTMLDGAALVVSADQALNHTVATAARARGIPCNCVDRPGLSTFIMPSIVDRAPVIVAIGTEGTAPVLGQGIRATIEAMLPVKLGQLATAAARLRSLVAKSLPAGRPRRDFWRQFFFGPAREALLAGDETRHLEIAAALIAGDANLAGNVVFVSAGTGDPELLALRAHRLLQEADVIVHDQAMPTAVLEFARRDATRLPVRSDDFTATADILLAEVRKGRRVIRLHLGPVSVEERAAVAAEAVAVEVVPGVSVPQSAELLSFRQRPSRVIEPLKAVS